MSAIIKAKEISGFIISN